LVQRLPLPLAQLYRRAHNALTPLERHLTAFYLWEASVKLLASVAVVLTAERGPVSPDLAERLQSLARPALGNWWEFVRLLVAHLADAGDSAFVSLRDLLLGRSSDDLPRSAGLDALLRELLENKPGARVTVRLTELYNHLVQLRNEEIGHGAVGQRKMHYYDRTRPALLEGVGELLGRLDVLAGRRLLYVAEVNRLGTGAWLVKRFELAGEMARRLESLEIPEAETARLPLPKRLYLAGPEAGADASGLALLSLHPLVLFDADSSRVFFLNSQREQRRADYLCYTTGVPDRRAELGQERRALLAQVLGGWMRRQKPNGPRVARRQSRPPSRRHGRTGGLSVSLNC